MKKVITIIVLSIVGLIVAATITLAIVPVSTYDAINGATKNGEKPQYINIYKDGADNAYRPSSDKYQEVTGKIMELYQKSLKASVMSSFFQGAMTYDEEVVNERTTGIDSVLKTKGSMYIEFIWDNETDHTLYFNKVEHTIQANNNKTTTIPFTSLAIEVKDTESFEDVTIYVINDTGSSRSCNYKIRTVAHQSELYEYIKGLDIKGTLSA